MLMVWCSTLKQCTRLPHGSRDASTLETSNFCRAHVHRVGQGEREVKGGPLRIATRSECWRERRHHERVHVQEHDVPPLPGAFEAPQECLRTRRERFLHTADKQDDGMPTLRGGAALQPYPSTCAVRPLPRQLKRQLTHQ